jgi:hypothetical protein
MINYEISFLKNLALTISIETIVLVLLFKLLFKKTLVQNWLLILTGILASFSTLPYLWFILPLFIKSKIYYMVISEISAVLIESVIIFGLLKVNYQKALLVSTACNVISFFTGLLFI